MNAQQALKFLKITGEGFSLVAWYTATLVKYLAWPVVPIGIVWILRKPIHLLIEGISELAFEYKGAKGSVNIKKPLDEFAKNFTQVKERVAAPIADLGKSTSAATTKAEAAITATPTVTSDRAEKAKAFRDTMGRYLENFDLMLIMATKAPVAAMSESWRLLKKTIVETAELYGAGGRDTSQALFYLTTIVLGSQDVMSRAGGCFSES